MTPVTWIRWRAMRVWHFLAEEERTACGIGLVLTSKVDRAIAERPPSPENICPRCAKLRNHSLPLFPSSRRAAP